MMKNDIEKIIERLDNHEKRLSALEGGELRSRKDTVSEKETKKQLTMPELIKGKKLKSGQEKIAAIVGYYEKVVKSESITQASVKEGWRIGKFDGKYNPSFILRAIEAGLIRNIDSQLDLSQTVEKFWDNIIK